jgi:integration host factor subunit alpha
MPEVITRESLAAAWKERFQEEEGYVRSLTRARDDVRWFFDAIADALRDGDEVRIHGFGNFTIQHRAARMGRNPRTGETVPVAARNVIRFAPSATLSASLKGSGRRAKR